MVETTAIKWCSGTRQAQSPEHKDAGSRAIEAARNDKEVA